jgi:hypothetical protein
MLSCLRQFGSLVRLEQNFALPVRLAEKFEQVLVCLQALKPEVKPLGPICHLKRGRGQYVRVKKAAVATPTTGIVGPADGAASELAANGNDGEAAQGAPAGRKRGRRLTQEGDVGGPRGAFLAAWPDPLTMKLVARMFNPL